MRRPAEGMQIDGFTLGARLHQGGFATIWGVTHALHRGAMIMKVPTILDGYDGPTIVGFEVEQMIMPRLTGPHVPRVVAVGGFEVMPYIVMEAVGGGPRCRCRTWWRLRRGWRRRCMRCTCNMWRIWT